MDWPDGVALLIFDTPIAGEFTEIDDTVLTGITGTSGYTCTVPLQEYDVDFCDYVGGSYEGVFINSKSLFKATQKASNS